MIAPKKPWDLHDSRASFQVALLTQTSYNWGSGQNDKANQLIREDNQAANKTWTWEYDNAGNILSRKEYTYTTGELGSATSRVNYTYGNSNWGDLLTAYNGQSITSDSIGNMLSDGTWTYTWKHGRELAAMSDGSDTWEFTYNADGLRTKRTNGTTTYNYVYNGSSLSQMTVGTHMLNFAYDASGSPMAVTYDGVTYYYATNLQGDIIAILDGSGNAVVQYTYDAWGKLLSTSGGMATTLGEHNPLRYRGYVYDPESSLYYLQSRYYDPELGRFINGDDYVSTGQGLLSKNAFAYCFNNPICYDDKNGAFPWLVVGIVAACIAVIGLDHALAANQPEGGYAVKNEQRENGARVKGLYAEGNGFEISHNGITVCDTEVGVASFTFENEHTTVEFLDCLTASATAEIDWSGKPSMDISAVASIYSPGIEFVLPLGFCSVTLEAEAYIGGIGAGLELDSDTGRIKITPPFAGVGGSYGIDYDLSG